MTDDAARATGPEIVREADRIAHTRGRRSANAYIERQIDLLAAQAAQRDAEGIEIAWGIIANAGGGDWTKETREWQEAAARWRDEHMDRIAAIARARHAATKEGT